MPGARGGLWHGRAKQLQPLPQEPHGTLQSSKYEDVGLGGGLQPETLLCLDISLIYSKVFSFVQTLTGCEDQAKLFKDEVRRAGG